MIHPPSSSYPWMSNHHNNSHHTTSFPSSSSSSSSFSSSTCPVSSSSGVTQKIIRDRDGFQHFLIHMLRRSGIRDRYLRTLFSSSHDCIGVYQMAFTHSSIHPLQNYEYFEILGDATCNKSIVWYIQERFPFLQNPEGVKVIARLRINLVSKKHFSSLADSLGFLPFISCEKEIMEQREKSILEDVFEAFFGATELLLDRIFGLGVGYFICYRLIKSILDEKEISLRYEDLFDPITRLKETFDYFRSSSHRRFCPYVWGSMMWEAVKKKNGMQMASLFQVDQKACRKELLSTATAPFLDEAKQLAATSFLQFLREKGFHRPVRDYYEQLLLLLHSHPPRKNKTKEEICY